MAITRTQIAKQLLAQGGRTGFQGGGADAGTKSFAESQGRSKAEVDQLGRDFGFSGRDVAGDEGRQRPDSAVITPPPKPPKTKDNTLPTLNFFEQIKVNNLKKQFELEKLRNRNKFGPLIGLVAQNFKAPELSFYESTSEDDIMDTDYGMFGEDLTRADRLADAINKAEKTGNITQGEFESAFYGPDGKPTIDNSGDGIQDPCKGPNPPAYCFVGIRSVEPKEEEKIEETFTPNLRLLAGGGMADKTVGGEYDFESARQMYGLGKLVKKVTRTVKKIAKSPIGKAAIGAALFKFGTPFIKSDAFKNFMFKKGVPSFSNLTSKGVMAGIGGISALAGLMTPEEEEEQKLYAGADIADPSYIMNNPELFTNPRLMAEGGSTEEKEPVAKKTMPLLDMGGKEKDYRETGGFVDMGRMEKADDVPARLSKNEFVFTADAVRNAGEGDIDKGAEVMYNMMKNLESGGEVSEESQGLEGAKKMFQTSQRLEGVM